jgi:RNA polymerase sigma-70 factor (ECF subfamily)
MTNLDPDGAHWPATAFATTHWSVVLAARSGDAAEASVALEKLCRTYWPPIYAFLRRQGISLHDAQDLTQEFLHRFLHREWLGHLRDQRGKFRSFLLAFLKHFLADQRDRAGAQKRGGGQAFIPLDAYAAEERDGWEPQEGLTADQVYERRWAQAVMNHAAERLRQDYAARGQSALYDQLKDLQPGEHGAQTYAQIGASLGLTEQAVKNAVHTLRRRYARCLHDEVAQTVTEPEEIQAELRHLLTIFAR